MRRLCLYFQTGLVIVDSPGIGETPEMKNLVLDYILKACTFIYVINSTCAGGVQDRVRIYVQDRKRIQKSIVRPHTEGVHLIYITAFEIPYLKYHTCLYRCPWLKKCPPLKFDVKMVNLF